MKRSSSSSDLRPYYLEVRLGRRLDGTAPFPGLGTDKTIKTSFGGRIGRRFNRTWALELGMGAGHLVTEGSTHFDSPIRMAWSDASWFTVGAAWRPFDEGLSSLFSIAADAGIAVVDARVNVTPVGSGPLGPSQPLEKTMQAPTGVLEARGDLPLGPFALGVRAGGSFMWNSSAERIPDGYQGAGAAWLESGFFTLWYVHGALQYTLPF